ncbi:hypothetical protein [Bacillus sp. 1006-3]|uniref:hypothetical protein n=1 Tax=Bacillus sp. 1006-3 TaxID=2922309 RepID=UPI001F0E764B|nr:hypothetical protein [Bacillus sp. 1006-3]MCH4866791.1 hypothetical protein [Bacillus sp. 1006-3]
MFAIYFDYKDLGQNIMLGVIVYEDMDKIIQETKTIKKSGKTNFDHTLEAWVYATELVKEEGFDDIKFLNQNKLIFDWLAKGNYTEERAVYYDQIKKNMMYMKADGANALEYEVIKGDKNEAKKYLKKAVTTESHAIKGDFMDVLFSQAQDAKVVPIKKRKRA